MLAGDEIHKDPIWLPRYPSPLLSHICLAQASLREEPQKELYLTGQVGVEYFALDDKPEFLPAPLAALTAAQVAADGGALSRRRHLVERK